MSAIVMNLAFNAIDAMPDGGELSVSTYETDSHSCLAVHDTGAGIPPHVREHMFEPAFTTKGKRGTGFGLSAVKRFVDDAGGEISVESLPRRRDHGDRLLPTPGQVGRNRRSRPGSFDRVPL